MRNKHIHIDHRKIAIFCKTHNIKKLSLFGSVLSDRFNDSSDIDILIEFKNFEDTPGLFEFIAIQEELSHMFGGRKIDLVTIGALRDHLRKEIIDSAEVQYEEAA